MKTTTMVGTFDDGSQVLVTREFDNSGELTYESIAKRQHEHDTWGPPAVLIHTRDWDGEGVLLNERLSK